MTTQQQFVFNSRHDALVLLWEPKEVIRSVNGVKKFVTEDQRPTQFVNGQFVTTDKLLAKKMLKHRHYGVFFELTPMTIVKDAVQAETESQASQEEKLVPQDVLDMLEDVEEDPVEDLSEEELEPSAEEMEELVAEKTDATIEAAPEKVQMAVIEEVNSFNEAQTYLKREFDLEHADVNSKDKVAEQAAAHGVSFPNYEM